MEIMEKLLKFKFHIILSLTLALFVFFSLYFAPSFLDIIKFFWPLFASTAMFLVAIVVFGRITPPPENPGEKTGEGLLDFVAGGETEHVKAVPIEEEANEVK